MMKKEDYTYTGEAIDLATLSADELIQEFAHRVEDYEQLRDNERTYLLEHREVSELESETEYDELHTEVDEAFCRVRECLRLIYGDKYYMWC